MRFIIGRNDVELAISGGVATRWPLIAFAALLLGQAVQAQPEPSSDGWIGMSAPAGPDVPIVLQFRREIDLVRLPKSFPVTVTADNRFILYVNGRRVAAGPSTGDVDHWREQGIDLAAHLKKGRNVVAAVVWNGVKPLKLPAEPTPQQVQRAEAGSLYSQMAPAFQQSVATGFRVVGKGEASVLSTSGSGWRVRHDEGHGFENGYRQLIKDRLYYVAGQPETIDAAKSAFGFAGPAETGGGWSDAGPAPDAAKRTLVLDRLPPQTYAAAPPGRVVRSDLPAGMAFPSRPVTIPPNSSVRLLVQRPTMVSAYPELDVAGGAGATVTVTWSEALYDAQRRKGDRDLIADRRVMGIHDTFMPDGEARTFAPLWWRTWRYAEIAVQTRQQPLVLKGMRAFETGYPFEQVGRFDSDDHTLSRIFDVGWRTARIDAHETYMDTAYWEQLQYAGDTRLQMLISYAVSGDARLAEQAIDAFASSNVAGGLMDGAYPERISNVIPPFSLTWVGMLDDWRMRQPDPAPIKRNLGRMRDVVSWFAKWRQPSGLLGQNGLWSFVDWVGQTPADRTLFPSYGRTNESCLLSVLWLGSLQQAGRIEASLGDAALGEADRKQADGLREAIRRRCWVPGRGLFADNPDGQVFSQHMNALAVLYDVATKDEAPGILDRIVASGGGIDAPKGMFTTSYYFSWYLVQAFDHAGLGDRYLGLLDTWRGLLKLNYTTWPEERGETRSDTHAWSAHPTADLLGIVAGIGPGSPGYATVRIAPALGSLKKLDATAATPAGPVTVSYRRAGGRLTAEIVRPAKLPGVFRWRGIEHPLRTRRTRLSLVAD